MDWTSTSIVKLKTIKEAIEGKVSSECEIQQIQVTEEIIALKVEDQISKTIKDAKSIKVKK